MLSQLGDDVFEMGCEMIDATSAHRPDVGRVVMDANGHAHPWCGPDGAPAAHYNPSVHYDMPSLEWVKTGEACDEDDDEPYDVGQYECRICRAVVVPPYTADQYQVYVPGLRWCRINGEPVMREEFERRYEAATKARASGGSS
jgi:hypothetical protein